MRTCSKMRQLESTVTVGKAARGALNTRKKSRRKEGIAAKSAGKIDAMLKLAAPRLRRPPDVFNADPLRVATQTYTLRFEVEQDLECRDPDSRRVIARVNAREVASQHGAGSAGPGKAAHRLAIYRSRLARPAVPKCNVPLCKGTNFKSVFLETITRLLGESFAVGLPAKSIVGRGDRVAGQASPDIARLFGKRMVRVL